MQQIQNVKTKMELMQHFFQYAATSKCKKEDGAFEDVSVRTESFGECLHLKNNSKSSTIPE